MARWKSGIWRGPWAKESSRRMPTISEEEETRRWEQAFNKTWPVNGDAEKAESYIERLERMLRKNDPKA